MLGEVQGDVIILRTEVDLTEVEGTFQEEMNDVQEGRGVREAGHPWVLLVYLPVWGGVGKDKRSGSRFLKRP